MTTKSIIKLLIPPIIWGGFARLRNSRWQHSDNIFDNQSHTFKNRLKSARGYLEYGVGKSTIWASKNSRASIYGIDSSAEWIAMVLRECGKNSRLNLRHIDLGPLGDWGRPVTLTKIQNIKNYADSYWKEISVNEIDLVLIDGRFRISCFYATIANAKAGCIVVFDDYCGRPIYSIIENDLKPMCLEGRQAIFEVPDLSNSQRNEFANKARFFELVFD